MESLNSRNYREIELSDSIVLIDDLNSDSNDDKMDKISDSDKVYHSCCVHTLNNQMEDDDDNNNDPGASETISVTFNERGTLDGKSDTDNEDFVRSESLESEVDKVEKEETGEKSEPDDYEEEVDEKEEDEEKEEKETEVDEIAAENDDGVEVEVEAEVIVEEVEVEGEAQAEIDAEEYEEEEMGEIAQNGNGISLETFGLLDDFETEYEEPMEQEEQELEQLPTPSPIKEEEEPLIEMNGKSLIVNQYLENNPLIATEISDDQVSLLTKHSNYKQHVIQLNSDCSTLCSASQAGSTSSSRTISKRLSKSSGIKAFKSFHKKITKLFK